MSKPVIGICTALERAQWSVWDQEAMLLPRHYVDAVQRAGGRVVMLPPDPTALSDPDELLDLIDGLMLAGGADIDPASYGAESHPETNGCVPERDRFEIALVRRALERDMPLLGICRGMQLLNVACGGTLRQHLPEELGHEEHRRVLGSFVGADHDVRLSEGSLALRVAGGSPYTTKSHHHQAVDQLGDGLEITGWAVMDELPEAIENAAKPFVLGVQWHPEADEASGLIGVFVEAVGQITSEQR